MRTAKTIGRIALIALAVILAAAAVLMLIWHDTTKIIWQNLTAPRLTLDQSEWTAAERAEFSPRCHIGGNPDLKALIIHGLADITVPHTQSERLAAGFEEVLGKASVTLNLIPGRGHAADMLFSTGELDAIRSWIETNLE